MIRLNAIQRARLKGCRRMLSELVGLANAIFWTMGLLTAAAAFWFWVFRLVGVW